MAEHPTGAPSPARTEVATVRRADASDVPAVAAVQARAWRTGYAGVVDIETLAGIDAAALEPAWHRAVTQPPSSRHVVLVACAGALVVGAAAVQPSPDPDAHPEDGELSTLVVDPDWRRTGHGSRLLAASVSALQQAGLSSVRIWTVAEDEAFRRFLTLAGLEPDGASRTFSTDSTDGSSQITEIRLSAQLAG